MNALKRVGQGNGTTDMDKIGYMRDVDLVCEEIPKYIKSLESIVVKIDPCLLYIPERDVYNSVWEINDSEDN